MNIDKTGKRFKMNVLQVVTLLSSNGFVPGTYVWGTNEDFLKTISLPDTEILNINGNLFRARVSSETEMLSVSVSDIEFNTNDSPAALYINEINYSGCKGVFLQNYKGRGFCLIYGDQPYAAYPYVITYLDDDSLHLGKQSMHVVKY